MLTIVKGGSAEIMMQTIELEPPIELAYTKQHLEMLF